MAIGQQWGRIIGEKIGQRVKNGGTEAEDGKEDRDILLSEKDRRSACRRAARQVEQGFWQRSMKFVPLPVQNATPR